MTKMINLALQGGGSHGAFTWGVLDRFLEEDGLAIEGISGTSAGAINAAVLSQGYHDGGAAGARLALERFWRRVSQAGWASPVHRSLLDHLRGTWNIDGSLGSLWLDQLGRMFSPYQTNPLNLSPLRNLLAEILDMEALSGDHAIKLFISATNVRTGKIRVFEGHEVTVDVLLASACLPQLFQAVVIGEDAYWDGGFMGNPAIFPLIYGCRSHDVVIVQINPIVREQVPRTAGEIMNRVNEITFNASLMGEMRAVAFVGRLIEKGQATGVGLDGYKDMHIHLVEDEAAMKTLGVASKLNTDLDFLLHLRDLGRAAAARWLGANYDAIGQRSSLDIRERFL